ncbi:outer membrane beta-barrel protein [Chryseobacterium sp. T16E-39]|uniref:outer membrane beta-barrel protein n=1 Tax=Chryseobacterium sp. T16E-39 TaxID=2015076 RepID=UPI0012F78C03|nr:outer membrane beta-barrel protein [Chryseobacterium sp. T16E-39]
MEDHTNDVPDGVWDDIKDELFNNEDENYIVGIPAEEHDIKGEEERVSGRKNRALVYRIAGIAAAIVLFIVVGKQLFKINDKIEPDPKVALLKNDKTLNKQDNVGDKEKSSTDKKADYNDQILSANAASGESAILSKNILNNSLARQTGKYVNAEKSLLSGVRDLEPLQGLFTQNKGFIQKPNAPIESGNKIIDRATEVDRLISESEIGQQNKSIASATKEKKQKAKKSWMLSLLTGKASSNSQQFPGYATINGESLTFDQVWSASSYSEDPFVRILVANQSQNVEATVRHKVPLNLGVSLYYNLGKKWGIGTGLNYTKLSSELHSGSQSNFVKSEQTIHYIGIPVQVNYNVIQKGRFTGYVTGGALVEKPVAGRFKTKYVVENVVTDETSERLEKQPVQVSLNTALGVQLKLVDKIGVYAEPGIGYHFKNDGSLNTIYKEKPLNFNIKFGIRVLLD